MLHLRIIRGPGKEDWLSVADTGSALHRGPRQGEQAPYPQLGRLEIPRRADRRATATTTSRTWTARTARFSTASGSRRPRSRRATRSPSPTSTSSSKRRRRRFAPKRSPLEMTVSVDPSTPAEAKLTIRNPARGRSASAGSRDDPRPRTTLKAHKALEVLYKADRIARDIEDIDQMLEHLMDLILEAITATRGYVFLLDQESSSLVPYVRRGPDLVETEGEIVVSRTILNTAVDRKESILSSDALVDERFLASQSVCRAKVRSAMCAPLVNRGKVLGVIYVDSTDQSNLYTEGRSRAPLRDRPEGGDEARQREALRRSEKPLLQHRRDARPRDPGERPLHQRSLGAGEPLLAPRRREARSHDKGKTRALPRRDAPRHRKDRDPRRAPEPGGKAHRRSVPSDPEPRNRGRVDAQSPRRDESDRPAHPPSPRGVGRLRISRWSRQGRDPADVTDPGRGGLVRRDDL